MTQSAGPSAEVQPFVAKDGCWSAVASLDPATRLDLNIDLNESAVDLTGGRVEVREVRRRQVFVDGKPVGTVFD